MVLEGDFVPGVVDATNRLKPVDGYNVFPFPSINGSPESVVGGGDTSSMFKDIAGRAGADQVPRDAGGGEIWAKRGGFSSPNKNVDASVYPRPDDPQTTASALATRSRSASTCPTCSRRRSAARPARASGRSSRTS